MGNRAGLQTWGAGDEVCLAIALDVVNISLCFTDQIGRGRKLGSK